MQRRMAALPVVEDLNVLKDVNPGFTMSLVVATMNQLSLKSSKETLHGRVIIGVAFTAHAGDHLLTGQQYLVPRAGILTAPVRMMDIPGRGLRLFKAI